MRTRGFILLIALLLAVGGSTLAAAEDGVSLKIVDKEPPADLDADVRDHLAPKAYQLSDENGLFYEFWFVPTLTASAITGDTRDTLLKVEEISLLGALVIHQEEHYDFRDDPIDPGTYVMRLGLQPKDGNHMGTAPFDTFGLLVPAAKDAEVREYPDHDTMVEMASEDTVAEHPPVLSLQPLDDATGDFPRLYWDDEDEWRFLYLKFPTATPDGKKTDLPLGLVIEGMGEL